MKCPKCKSIDIEIIIVNKNPVYEYTCSGMHTRINNVVVHKEYQCKNCTHTWK